MVKQGISKDYKKIRIKFLYKGLMGVEAIRLKSSSLLFTCPYYVKSTNDVNN